MKTNNDEMGIKEIENAIHQTKEWLQELELILLKQLKQQKVKQKKKPLIRVK